MKLISVAKAYFNEVLIVSNSRKSGTCVKVVFNNVPNFEHMFTEIRVRAWTSFYVSNFRHENFRMTSLCDNLKLHRLCSIRMKFSDYNQSRAFGVPISKKKLGKYISIMFIKHPSLHRILTWACGTFFPRWSTWWWTCERRSACSARCGERDRRPAVLERGSR